MRESWVHVLWRGSKENSTLQEFPDRWNPMFVRELRRMLKSKAFGVSFFLLLLLCWGTTLVMLLNRSDALRYREIGPEFFNAYLLILSIPLCFVIPLSLFASISEEHNEQTIEVLSITAMNPGKILEGYFWTGMAHAGIYYAAVVPFICFSYLLQGVGLLELVLGLLFIVVITAMAAYWGLTLGACASGPIKKGFCICLTMIGGLTAWGVMEGTIATIIAIGANSDATWSLMTGLTCFFVFSLPVLAIVTGVARQSLQLVDPLVKPYRVKLDSEGNVVRFVARYNSLHVQPPILSDDLPDSLNEKTRSGEQ